MGHPKIRVVVTSIYRDKVFSGGWRANSAEPAMAKEAI
jgi:hypothetical protein